MHTHINKHRGGNIDRMRKTIRGRDGQTDGRRKGGRHSKEKKGDRGEWGEEEKDGKGTGDEWMPANCEHILQQTLLIIRENAVHSLRLAARPF